MKKNPKTYWRNKADKALQDYIRAKYSDELCWACGERYVTVGHHFFSVANSNATRYYLPNIIPMCKECHCLVHCQPHLVEPKICFKLGQEWYDDLIEVKRQGVKANLGWYKLNFEILNNMLKELSF